MPVSRQQTKASSSALRKTVGQKKRSQVISAKKTSLLFQQSRSVCARRRRAGPPHFAKQTMSSQRRQQPPRQQQPWQPQPRQPPYSPIKHSAATTLPSSSQVHSSTPLGLPTEERKKENLREQLAKDHSDVEDHLSQDSIVPLTVRGCDQRANVKAAARPTTGSRATSSEHCSDIGKQRVCFANPTGGEERIQIARVGDGSPVCEQRVDLTSSGDEQRTWMESISATLAHQSNQLEAFKRFTQKQLSQLQQKLSSTVKPKETADEVVSTSGSGDGSPKSEDESSLCYARDCEQLEGLVERLRELEGEEEAIRQRWCTIAYEDPPLAKPPVVYHEEEKLSRESGKILVGRISVLIVVEPQWIRC